MAEQKRIAFLCHPYHRGGVTRWMADAAIALSRSGDEVYFVTVAPVKEFVSGAGRETLLQLLGKERNTVQILKIDVGYEFEFGTPEYRTYIYKKLLIKVPPGTPIILADDNSIWEAATALFDSYPLIGVLHADEAYYYKQAERYSGKIDVLACVSGRVSKTVKEKIADLDPAKVYTIPCGINLPDISVNTIRGNVLQLVYAGRVSDYQKRTGDLVKICVLLAEKNIAFHLNVIGDGNAKIPLENKVKEYSLQEHITFSGWLSQKEVSRYLSESDILVLTSDFEGTPIAMMEAFAAGCGMVGTRVSGIEDYEYHPLAADCLGVYAIGDIEDAVSKIIKIAAIPVNTREHAARMLAVSEFSMEVCLHKYLNAIETVKKRTMSPLSQIRLSSFDLLYSKTIATARYLKVAITRK